MLEYLRNAADKPVAKILIGILAFSFVGWGVAEWIFSNVQSDNNLVYVGDTGIDAVQFSNEKNVQLANMDSEELREVYANPIAMDGVNKQVLAALISRARLDNRAYDLGLIVSDSEVARQIRSQPEFQSGGQFSSFAYDNWLRENGYTENDAKVFIRNQVLQNYISLAPSAPIKVPDFAVKAEFDARYSERKIDYVTVDFGDFNVGTPTEEDLRAFYAQNPRVVPEQRTVSYVLVAADMNKPDEADVAHTAAEEIATDLFAGEKTMAEIAKNHDAKYVSLGTFDADNRPDDELLTDGLMAQIFDMEQGIESEVIQTDKGLIIVMVDEIIPEHNAQFDAVKDSLIGDWRTNEQRKQAYLRANELLVDLNESGQLDGKKTAMVTRTDGAPLAVVSAAFNSEIGSNSIVNGNGVFYVLHVENEILPEPDQKKMADVRKELENASGAVVAGDYNSFLEREYPVEINEKVYRRFFD